MFLTQTKLPQILTVMSLVFCLSFSIHGNAQEKLKPEAPSVRVEMTQDRMAQIISELTSEYQGPVNRIEFTFKNVPMALVSDEKNNRMRIIAPIISVENLNEELLQAAMVSNFHLALDARYAIGKGVLYAAYIHPLKELTDEQLKSAVKQVASLRLTFGTTFTSGQLNFGGRSPKEQDI